MRMLREAADKGSLSAAARSLRVPVPTLSRKISDLEASLGARLLIRTTRRLALTDAGATYLAAARRILEQVEDAEREAAGEFSAPRGRPVITTPLQFGRSHVLPIVADFLERFPAIDVRLLLADRNVHLLDGHVDMAVRIGELEEAAGGATRVDSMRVVVCAGPAPLARHGTPATPADLRDVPAVGVETPLRPSGWRFRQAGSGAPTEVPVRTRLSVTTTDAAVQAAIRGIGVTRLPHYQAAEAVAAGMLRIVLEEHEPVPVHLVHAARGQLPLKMRRFLDLAAPRLREDLARLASGP